MERNYPSGLSIVTDTMVDILEDMFLIQEFMAVINQKKAKTVSVPFYQH